MFGRILKEFEVIVASKAASLLLGQKTESLIVVEDARSAVYYATGIAAQSRRPTVVFVCGNNESRSAFSGMTEAYYRNIPILLVSIGSAVDYSLNLNDVGSLTILDLNDFDKLDLKSLKLPSHIVINLNSLNVTEKKEFSFNELNSILNEDDYLYISNNHSYNSKGLKCKFVIGGMNGCSEGAIANVLGASLSKMHKRYFAILSEEEFIHDMNTIGNVCYNDSIRLICLSNRKDLVEYVESLGLKTVKSFSGLAENKTVLFLNGNF